MFLIIILIITLINKYSRDYYFCSYILIIIFNFLISLLIFDIQIFNFRISFFISLINNRIDTVRAQSLEEVIRRSSSEESLDLQPSQPLIPKIEVSLVDSDNQNENLNLINNNLITGFPRPLSPEVVISSVNFNNQVENLSLNSINNNLITGLPRPLSPEIVISPINLNNQIDNLSLDSSSLINNRITGSSDYARIVFPSDKDSLIKSLRLDRRGNCLSIIWNEFKENQQYSLKKSSSLKDIELLVKYLPKVKGLDYMITWGEFCIKNKISNELQEIGKDIQEKSQSSELIINPSFCQFLNEIEELPSNFNINLPWLLTQSFDGSLYDIKSLSLESSLSKSLEVNLKDKLLLLKSKVIYKDNLSPLQLDIVSKISSKLTIEEIQSEYIEIVGDRVIVITKMGDSILNIKHRNFEKVVLKSENQNLCCSFSSIFCRVYIFFKKFF